MKLARRLGYWWVRRMLYEMFARVVVVAVVSAIVACNDDATRLVDAPNPVDTDGTIDAAVDGPPGRACPLGSTVRFDRTSCDTTIVAPSAALATGPVAIGDLVSLAGIAEGTLPCVPALVCAPDGSATLVFSDDPESPSTDGVLYADTIGPGRVRVYVYHVNGGASPRKFSVVLLEQAGIDAHATITKSAVGTAGTDYVTIGRDVAAAWLASASSTIRTIPANTRVVLDGALDGVHATTTQLVHAIYDLELDHPVKLSVVSVAATADTVAVTAGLALIANDGLHDRGTFPDADLWLVADPAPSGSTHHLRLGGNVTEDDLHGRDATTGAVATLRGNYGLAYRIVAAPAPTRRIAASARGGAWAGAIRHGVATAAIPTSGALASTTEAVWLGIADADITLISGGGSSLPIDLVVIDP